MRSITKHYDQLLWTLVLMVFILWFYSAVIFENFQGEFAEGEITCDSVWVCFTQTFNEGIRQGGGIGDVLNRYNQANSKYYATWILVVTFFIIINVIFLNIIFGIIIDTFSELRDHERERLYDETENCFVCGVDRTEFCKMNDDFDKHLKEEHNLWHYVFF